MLIFPFSSFQHLGKLSSCKSLLSTFRLEGFLEPQTAALLQFSGLSRCPISLMMMDCSDGWIDALWLKTWSCVSFPIFPSAVYSLHCGASVHAVEHLHQTRWHMTVGDMSMTCLSLLMNTWSVTPVCATMPSGARKCHSFSSVQTYHGVTFTGDRDVIKKINHTIRRHARRSTATEQFREHWPKDWPERHTRWFVTSSWGEIQNRSELKGFYIQYYSCRLSR